MWLESVSAEGGRLFVKPAGEASAHLGAAGINASCTDLIRSKTSNRIRHACCSVRCQKHGA